MAQYFCLPLERMESQRRLDIELLFTAEYNERKNTLWEISTSALMVASLCVEYSFCTDSWFICR